MRLSFRARLATIALTACMSLVVLVIAGTVTSNRTEAKLSDIQQRYLPKLEAGPRLTGQFERLQRALQDAVAARDTDALAAARQVEERLLTDLSASSGALTVGQIAAVRSALDDYFVTAMDVGHRLISGETGERVVEAMGAMQAKQKRADDLFTSVTAFDRTEMVTAFSEAREAQIAGKNIRFTISIACLLGVVALSLWMSRALIRSVADVGVGLKRFGSGDFSRRIAVANRDEIGELAIQANQMAASLQAMANERERADWIKGALAGVTHELRGELDPTMVAERALSFVASYFGAPVAALYYTATGAADPTTMTLFAAHARQDSAAGARPSLGLGEGLAGQAALQDDIVVLDDPPADYLRVRSGLGEAAPRTIVFVPLRHLGRGRGVLELALFAPWSERMAEAMSAVRENVVIALEVARARATMKTLLEETQRQAEQLVQQEDALRSTNEELQAQQEELRQSNHELANQRRTLERNNLELDDTRRALEQRAAELTTVSAYKSQFLANMSHELRTPLNSMLLLSNLLAENQAGTLTAKQVEYAATIHASGKDLLALINQVLDLAKIEAGKQQAAIAQVRLVDIVDPVERIFAPLAADKGLAFSVDIAADVPETMATDGKRVEQILRNFLGNAIKFTESGTVTLRVARSAADVVFRDAGLQSQPTLAFSVSDTGVGIAIDDQQRIFAPFEQVDGAVDRRYGGTGLGLSISSELAALLGGELHVVSEPGKGSTFTLHLPVEPRAATPAQARPPATASSPRAASPSSPLLIIEDDGRFADTLAHVIRSQGLDCLLAFDGEAGLRLARERQPAAIILDVNLPDTDGWQVMAALKADPETARIPVHFVSGVDAAERGLAMGAVGYLTKPAAKQDLIRMIEALASKASDGANRILVVEDDVVTGDSVARQLEAAELEVHRATSAAGALEALQRMQVACMVLDLGLPDMDGLVLLETLRAQHGPAMPAVVIYTGRALSKSETKTLEAYTESVVLKDGASDERLLDEVRIFVRRVKEGRPEAPAVASRLDLGEGHLKGKTILVTDDDMRTVYAMSAMLRAKGAEVFVADTGQAALDVLDSHPDVDAALMDIMMPEMDGYEAMRRIRTDPRFGRLPIIALTARAMKGERERCIAAGATNYLAKPVDGDRLMKVLHAVMRRDDDGMPDVG